MPTIDTTTLLDDLRQLDRDATVCRQEIGSVPRDETVATYRALLTRAVPIFHDLSTEAAAAAAAPSRVPIRLDNLALTMQAHASLKALQAEIAQLRAGC